jgi:hypothetical protein
MFSTIKRALARRRDILNYSIPAKRRPTTSIASVIKLRKRQEKALQELKEAGKYGPDQKTHSE